MSNTLSRRTLYKARPDSVKRLADYLKLNTEGFSHRHRCRLVAWRLTRKR